MVARGRNGMVGEVRRGGMREPCGDGAVLYLDHGGGHTNLHVG